ncbi:class I SAM-dependent methyltransferase [Microbacterium luticocti]|uniref:class I SAM-dependent methyltransferase n=1 Tax=Microbacterium luticocti TaxID=451764 RepID=UPI00040A5DAA|nr:SAM-dependent methyltransferase [Microbacterium luticocti]
MEPNTTVSTTALMSAAARAAHPLVDAPPHLLIDEIAAALVDHDHPSPLDYHRAQPDAPVLASARLAACVRSAFAEARLAESGVDQLVVLGAGLDTAAHRMPVGTHAWLVDLPGVLAHRRALFARAGLADAGTPVPVDLASASPVDALCAAGFDPDRPAFVSWLGVSMYLDAAAVRGVLAGLRALAGGSHLVFDHIVPPALRDAAGAGYAQAVAAVAGRSGEPWHCTPSPDQITDWLADAGWAVREACDETDAAGPGFWPRSDALTPMRLVRLVHAVRETTGAPAQRA